MVTQHMRALLAGTATTLTLVSSPALAQEPPTQEEAEATEIVVTATRREERLQDVPLSVTAVSGDEIAASGLKEVTDIQYLAPNITFSSTNPVANGGGYQIRGIGTQTFDSGVEQTVGLVVDGVVIGLSRDPGATGFADIERVEVLRGPQGTLFGKNASAGLIQVITRRPELGDYSLDVDLAYGEREDQLQRATVNVPLGESAALRISGFHNAQEGAIPNLVNGTNVGDRENEGIRARLLWEPTQSFSVLMTAEHQTAFARDAHTLERLGINPGYNGLFASFPVQPGPGVYVAFQDGDWTASTDSSSVSGEINWDIGAHTLTSITAYRELETLQLADIDAAPVDLFNHSDGGVDSNQFTQELRLTSPSGERLEYVAGLYYYHTENAGFAEQYGLFGGAFGGLPGVIAGGRREQVNTVDSYAVFGQATFALTNTVSLTGGLRYTDDSNHAVATVTPLPFPALVLSPFVPYEGTVTAQNWSGRIGIEYRPNDDLLLYASYATGYKGPAIDGTGGVITEVDPETVASYELGLKSTLLDGRATFNVALYESNFEDFQTTSLDTNRPVPAFLLTNAGGMRARGVEVETSYAITDRVSLSANAAYSDATFREFLGPCYAGQPSSAPGGGGCYVQPGTASTLVSDYAGYRLPNAPLWTYGVRLNLEQPISAGMWVDASANWAWRSETQSVLGDPNAEIDSYGLLNGTIGVNGGDGAWRVAIYARNLLDERFFASYAAQPTFNPGGYLRIVSPEAFRTVGVATSFRF